MACHLFPIKYIEFSVIVSYDWLIFGRFLFVTFAVIVIKNVEYNQNQC